MDKNTRDVVLLGGAALVAYYLISKKSTTPEVQTPQENAAQNMQNWANIAGQLASYLPLSQALPYFQVAAGGLGQAVGNIPNQLQNLASQLTAPQGYYTQAYQAGQISNIPQNITQSVAASSEIASNLRWDARNLVPASTISTATISNILKSGQYIAVPEKGGTVGLYTDIENYLAASGTKAAAATPTPSQAAAVSNQQYIQYNAGVAYGAGTTSYPNYQAAYSGTTSSTKAATVTATAPVKVAANPTTIISQAPATKTAVVNSASMIATGRW